MHHFHYAPLCHLLSKIPIETQSLTVATWQNVIRNIFLKALICIDVYCIHFYLLTSVSNVYLWKVKGKHSFIPTEISLFNAVQARRNCVWLDGWLLDFYFVYCTKLMVLVVIVGWQQCTLLVLSLSCLDCYWCCVGTLYCPSFLVLWLFFGFYVFLRKVFTCCNIIYPFGTQVNLNLINQH